MGTLILSIQLTTQASTLLNGAHVHVASEVEDFKIHDQ